MDSKGRDVSVPILEALIFVLVFVFSLESETLTINNKSNLEKIKIEERRIIRKILAPRKTQ